MFNFHSPIVKELLVERGHHANQRVYDDNWGLGRTIDNPEKDITVLQMVICGDMEVMAELVYTKDYVMQFINKV